jgi:hypothetical protein
MLTIRWRGTTAPVGAALVNPSPSPTVEPSPSPAPVPTTAPKREAKKPVVQPKKHSKVRSALNKVKRIFKNPF